MYFISTTKTKISRSHHVSFSLFKKIFRFTKNPLCPHKVLTQKESCPLFLFKVAILKKIKPFTHFTIPPSISIYQSCLIN